MNEWMNERIQCGSRVASKKKKERHGHANGLDLMILSNVQVCKHNIMSFNAHMDMHMHTHEWEEMNTTKTKIKQQNK